MKFERHFGRIRRQRGLHVEAAAALLRISTPYLKRLERGAVPLSWSVAERMCAIYHTSMGELTRPW